MIPYRDTELRVTCARLPVSCICRMDCSLRTEGAPAASLQCGDGELRTHRISGVAYLLAGITRPTEHALARVRTLEELKSYVLL